MKISWKEPKAIYWPRWKQKIKDVCKSTSWLRVGFWLFVFLPATVGIFQIYYPNPRFSWFHLPLIFMFLMPLICLVIAMKFSVDKPRVTIDDEGIKLRGPEDGLFSNYPFNKITSINVIHNESGNAVLSWEYKGKTLTRGIPHGVDLNRIQTIIELNSKLKLTNKES